MFKKTLVLALVLVLLVGLLVLPASAATVTVVDYNDYITNISVDGDNDIVTLNLSAEGWNCRVTGDNGVSEIVAGSSITFDFENGVYYDVDFWWYYFDSVDIPTGTSITYTIEVDDYGGTTSPYVRAYFPTAKATGGRVDWNGGEKVIYPTGTFSVGTTLSNKSASTVYVQPYLTLFDFSRINDRTQQTVTLESCVVTMSISSLYRLQQETGKTNAILTRVETELKEQGKTLDSVLEQQQMTNDKLEELPGEIGNEMQGVIDSENEAAAEAGDSSVNELLEIIPDESQGFMNAIQSLVSSMSYNGTEAKLPVPSIIMPAIPGVMDSLKLTDELYVDFGYWVQQLPGGVLRLVQILCTIALIVYCFKELYSMIAYAMTLKGGGSGE